MKYLLFSFLMLSAICSCNMMGERVKGSGTIKTESRNVDSFDEIDVSGNIDVYVTQGAAGPVRVETDDNLLELIEIETRGDKLVIRPRNNYNLDPTDDIKVYVSTPEVNYFGASGACHIYSENKITGNEKVSIDLSGACGVTLELNAPAVDAQLSGACEVRLKGETKNLDIDGSGSTSAKCYELKTENTNIDLSGAGHAEVFASVKLDADVSGAGTVRYRGSPIVNQSVSGAGNVSKE